MTDQHPLPGQPDTSRRSFLKTGLGGTLLLSTISVSAGLSGCATAPAGRIGAIDSRMDASYQFQFLSRDDIALFEALLPAILAGSLPDAQNQRRQTVASTIERIDQGIVKFGPPNQRELRKLFDLLNFPPTRMALARTWSDWPSVTATDADAFLQRWRNSRIGLLNNGYVALTKISNAAFYGYADHWHLTGYPGPPAWMTESLPQFTSA
ncbi:hypothetical protein KUV44_11220 [Marinobacter daepoensis]|uniref:Gluconate 2-dehydrogenase subunit 3 n=1 Tax=Marinobacter daepoensis TaxID=262077 RepID=A0ABS3BF29_9GAMM|nr:hypothetical protein [Marinobacter daepoensis]MBN7770264.1 hypothetical protein [Marinobacter daepoensis]MBY6033794.1 hypothetical protein [Marinobacter daepoensis]MBY6079710.1 hypothetical protein [Marinobacter daepoensis]